MAPGHACVNDLTLGAGHRREALLVVGLVVATRGLPYRTRHQGCARPWRRRVVTTGAVEPRCYRISVAQGSDAPDGRPVTLTRPVHPPSQHHECADHGASIRATVTLDPTLR